MTDYTLPGIRTVKEVAGYLKIGEDTVLEELESGRLHGFRVGEEWRCSEAGLLAYIGGQTATRTSDQPEVTNRAGENTDWNIVEIEPFDFYWPKRGGGGAKEHYDKAYSATRAIDGRHCTMRLGFGHREVAGQMRRRVTVWIGNRAIVEFAGSNSFESDGLLAGIIRLKNGKQLSPYQSVPEKYRDFKLDRYDTVVDGPRASTSKPANIRSPSI